jgi:hypothetical protein
MSDAFIGYSILPPTPKEIAIPHAEQFSRPDYDHSQDDARILEELEQMAYHLGFLGQRYFVDGTRSFVIPADTDDADVTYASYYGTMFEGELISYSRISIGRLVGHGAVRALCLTFDKALLLPTFEETQPSELLHIPAFAIDSIARVN